MQRRHVKHITHRNPSSHSHPSLSKILRKTIEGREVDPSNNPRPRPGNPNYRKSEEAVRVSLNPLLSFQYSLRSGESFFQFRLSAAQTQTKSGHAIHALWFIRNTVKFSICLFLIFSKNGYMIVAYLLLIFLVN